MLRLRLQEEQSTMSDPDLNPEHAGTYRPGYFETRLALNPNRGQIWVHICDYLSRFIPATSRVLELGAGWCDFSNHIRAARVVAMDLDSTVERAAADHVEAVIGDCTDLTRFQVAEFDVVFASNLL